MTRYTVEVTNDPQAPVAGGGAVWQTVHDGPIESDHGAKKCALELAAWFRFVRVARDGMLWYIPPQIPRNQPELPL
jgi:hypothetical protein